MTFLAFVCAKLDVYVYNALKVKVTKRNEDRLGILCVTRL